MASPSRFPPQQEDHDGFQNPDQQQNQQENHPPPPSPPRLPPQEPPHSETLETPEDPSNPQFPLPVDDQENQNPQDSGKEEDTLLILDQQQQQPENDHQSGIMPLSPTPNATNIPEPITVPDGATNPPPPLTSPTNFNRRPNKRKKGGRKQLKRKKSMKKTQTLTENLKPIPFVPTKSLDFDKHEEVLKRLGLWDFSRIEFDRNIRVDLVVELILNYDFRKRCSYVNDRRINVNRADLARALKLPAPKLEKGSSAVEEVDLDSEVFSDEAIRFIDEFVSSWVLLHDDTWIMPTEVLQWTRCIKDGHPEKMDSASLIWYMVEKELTQGDKLVDCYYASHLQYLMKSQREEVFRSEMELEEVKEEEDAVGGDGDENMKAEEEEEEENVSLVQERSIELTLETEVEEVQEEVKRDEMVVDEEELKEEEEHGNWLMAGNSGLGEPFLQRCQASDLNGYEDRKPEMVEDEQVEQVEEDDEEEVEERDGDGFDMEANDDSLDRDGLTDNFLQGIGTSHIPFGSQGDLRGMSSVGLFGSRDGPYMGHGGPSFFSNGGKRVMEPEEDVNHHSLNGNAKRLKTDEMWDQKPTDFSMCMEQMQQWMEKAKMIHESKEESYENSQFHQQMAINQLQERQNFMEMLIKSKDEELEKKQTEIFRLERELYLMGDLVAGYRKALSDTRHRFSEYRKLHPGREESLYKDAGPGGLVLSTRELEKQRLKQEEEDKMKILMLIRDHEQKGTYALEMHGQKVLMMIDRLASFENEVKQLKELSAYRKAVQKSQDEREPSAQEKEVQKSEDEKLLSAQLQEIPKTQDEQELSAQMDDIQKSQNEELSAQLEEIPNSQDEQDASQLREIQKSQDEQEVSVQLEEIQKPRDELPENDADVQSVNPDAAEPQEVRDGDE